MLQDELLNSTSRILYFNECVWVFQIFYYRQYIPVWYTPINYGHASILYMPQQALRERTKQFSPAIIMHGIGAVEALRKRPLAKIFSAMERLCV